VIGVLSRDSEAQAVHEFFQLFKMPWEFYVPQNTYDLILVTRDEMSEGLRAFVLVIYHSHAIRFDDQIGVVTESRRRGDWVEWQGAALPVYGDVASFRPVGQPLISRRGMSETVGTYVAGPERSIVRIGYDLFHEVQFLLSQGQPAENARFPTLDTHISLLRVIMVSLGVPFVEVPPAPAGYDFMACLTHDVDFVGIRDHKCDHTM